MDGIVLFCSILALLCVFLIILLILPLPFSIKSIITKYVSYLKYIYLIPRIILVVFIVIEAMALKGVYNSSETDMKKIYLHQRNIFLSLFTFVTIHVLHLLSSSLNKLLNDHKLLQEQLAARKSANLRLHKDHDD